MIVLVILTIVLGMAAPRVAKNMALLHLRTTAKQVAADLRWARSQALCTGKIYNAVFDCGQQRLIISDYASDDRGGADLDMGKPMQAQAPVPEEAEGQPLAQKPVLKIYDLPEEVYFSRIAIADIIDDNPGKESIYQMTFYPDGTSRGGEVSIADEERRSFLVGVDVLTGIVSLEEPD